MNVEGFERTAKPMLDDDLIADRFRLGELLSDFPHVRTWRALDEHFGEAIVVKSFRTEFLAAGARASLEHEIAMRRNTACEHLPRIIATGEQDGERYAAMEFVAGVCLRDRIRRGPIGVIDTLKIAEYLCLALSDLHRLGILHRDLRPENIIVNDGQTVDWLKLVDIASARSFEPDRMRRDRLQALVTYMSPEQAGSIDVDVGEASDLYALGIVLFECLAGSPPFGGCNPGTVLFEHLTAEVPDIRVRNAAVPRALEELIHRLLRKDPLDRYQLASAVLHDIRAISNSPDHLEGDATFAIGSTDRRRTLTEPSFVARADELARIEKMLHDTRRGECGMMLVECESGGGKSRLLMEVAKQARRNGIRVLRGQGSTQVGDSPFRLLSGVVDGFMSMVQSDPTSVEAIRRRMEDHLPALCAALPSLRQVFSDQQGDRSPAAFGETRTIQALARFWDALGAADSPVVIVLDDCQWADELTFKLFQRWRSARTDSSRFTTVVAAFRSEEVGEGHLLRRLNPTLHMRLAPFDSTGIGQLLESMAGSLPALAVEVVTRLADGSPFMAGAILRGLVESRALIPEASGWRVEPIAIADVASSRHAGAVLAKRIELLSEATVTLLAAGAVVGKEFDLQIVCELAQMEHGQAVWALAQARERRLIWLRSDGASYVFVHDQIRASLLGRLTQAQQQQMHLRAAIHLQRQGPEQWSDIAFHFDAGGDGQAALPYAMLAAKQARDRFALDTAERQYRIARRGARHADAATRFQIAEGLGDALMLRGQYAEAQPLFIEAEGLAEGQAAKAEIQAKLAELCFKRGDMESATTGFETALRMLGRKIPTSAATVLCFLIWEAVVQIAHTTLPRLLVHRIRRPPSENERLTIRLFSLLTYGYWYTRSKSQCLWAHLRGLNFAERFPPTPELAHAYSEHAPVMCLVPLFQRALKYAERSLQLRKQFQDAWGQGQSLNFYSVVLYAASRYRECIDRGREAVRLLERTGDYWQMHIARYQVAASLYRLGEFQEALEECRLNHQSGLDSGDEQASGIILDVWARATMGHVPGAILEAELERNRQDQQGLTQVLLADGICLLESGKIEQAVERLRQAVGTADRAGIQNAYTLPSLAWLATACRRQLEASSIFASTERDALLKDALSAVRRALRSAKLCRNDLPRALRESGLLAAMSGDPRRARAHLDQSLEIARSQEALPEQYETLRARGQVGQATGWTDWKEDLARAAELQDQLLATRTATSGTPAGQRQLATMSLADRFDTVLETGRRIASALSPMKIYEESHAAILRLLRGECCVLAQVVEQDGQKALQAVLGSPQALPDHGRLIAAMNSGRAIVLEDDLTPEVSDAGNGQIRSTILVPIQVRGATQACMYVTNSHVRGLFGPDEERLADFVAVIAGAALENAEGFRKLEILNATLEQRVAERTRAAEEANEAKSRFLATMSHEIRTPMNGILGMTELTLRSRLSEQQRNSLNIVRRSGDALLALLNDILDLSKIEAGKMELEEIPFNPVEVITEAARLMGVFAGQKRLELICRIAPDLPQPILGDAGRLRQILVNLIGNALKFTDNGEVYVNMERRCGESGTDHLHVFVRDTGPGIPREKQSLIFESFSQSDSSTTRRYGGSGLGLSISAQLVALMNGRIWVESEVGRGSTFHFEIPIRAPQQVGAVLHRGALDGFTVVLASSRQSFIQVCRELLTHAGANAIVCDTVEGLRGQLEVLPACTHRFWGLLLDVAAAESNAEQWFDERILKQLAAIPTLVLVPANGSGTQWIDHGLPARRCLTKPVCGPEMIRAVQELFHEEDAEVESAYLALPTDPPRSLHVLIADDSPVNQEVAVAFLELMGHSSQVVGSGPEVVAMFEKQPFDLILMDLEMPGFDGFDATRLIRELERNRETRTPIVAMTAHALTGFRELCLAAGMDDYVTKPLQADVLSSVIGRLQASTGSIPVLENGGVGDPQGGE